MRGRYPEEYIAKKVLWVARALLLSLCTCLWSCQENISQSSSAKLFTQLPASSTGIDFENRILESEQLHYYKYLYIYIGGGVAAADFNNDGLVDLFFTSNIYHNRLFLNKGDFKFEDITKQAGIEKRVGFDAGVSVADVNNDGFLDIYINRAGWYTGDERLANMLYINNGDLSFREAAAEHGLDDRNRSISSTFFDYDKDGDLDVYISNAPTDFNLSGALLDLERIQEQSEKIRQAKSSDKLYRNNGEGFFEDVSLEAGIQPDLGFGLNAQVSDLNNDCWPDIYVSNDFIMPDFAYVNNGDGTFTDRKEELFKHISYYSMGADFADINNDGLSDLMVLDMSPEDHIRSKTTMSMMPIERFNTMIDNGYHHQYMHNVMQLNNGNGSYSEIANFSNIAKTDWSWAALFADYDLDGYNDLYVTNGIYRDVVDRDANTEINQYINAHKNQLSQKDFYDFTQKLPQQKLRNYLYKNEGNLQFQDMTATWSDLKETFSNGAIYADLDNDGDLDIVTNNLEEPATILRNNSREQELGHFLQLSFNGPANNRFGVGAKVVMYMANGERRVRQLINSRGYLSSLPNRLHFGLSRDDGIDSLVITWADDKEETLLDVAHDQAIVVDYANAGHRHIDLQRPMRDQFFHEVDFPFEHQEKIVNDFDKQLLLPHKLSQLGPAIAKADLNNDQIDDLYLGGGHGQSAQLLMSDSKGEYQYVPVADFVADRDFEDVSACFFDADGDGDEDLYVVSGSYEFDESSALLQDRLYLNQGDARFERAKDRLPELIFSGSVVCPADIDQDGDLDLFVGGRLVPGRYPRTPESALLINEDGRFENRINALAQELTRYGMVTTAQWSDIDQDDDLDLIISGEWQGVDIFINDNGLFSKSNEHPVLSSRTGWWNKIVVEDIDQDGDYDILAGNLGMNYKLHASSEKPLHVYTSDFDQNGTDDIVLAKPYGKEVVPVRGKNCTTQQMPYLKDRIRTYQQFASSSIQEIIGESFDSATHMEAVEFRSGYFLNHGGRFEFIPFPSKAQLSVINSIICSDFDHDGHKDLLLAGNNYMAEVETTRADAGIGVFLKGESSGQFSFIENWRTGFFASRDVRNMLSLSQRQGNAIIVANNDDRYQLFKVE